MSGGAGAGDRVLFHSVGRLESGQVFHDDTDGDPLACTLGADEIVAGLDAAMRGMAAGDTKTVSLAPEAAYGDWNPAASQVVRADQCPGGTAPELGTRMAMQTPDGREVPVRVTEVEGEFVTLDANHPLAGHTLIFDIEMVEVTPAE